MLLTPLRKPQVNRFNVYSTHFICSLFRARESLRQCLPDALRDDTFLVVLKQEESVLRWLNLLVKNINDTPNTSVQALKPSAPGLPATNAASVTNAPVNQWLQKDG
jgi:hypothetical protein